MSAMDLMLLHHCRKIIHQNIAAFSVTNAFEEKSNVER